MYVTVRNAKDKTLVKLLKLAAHSYAGNLLSPQLSKNITVTITVKDNIDAGGYCDYEFSDTGNPREFRIDIIRTNRTINMFKILAHEMVHLKQLAKGEMKDRFIKSRCITSWFGVKYDEDYSYWDQPWEIEAYGLENSLVAKFLMEQDQFKNLKQKQADWFL